MYIVSLVQVASLITKHGDTLPPAALKHILAILQKGLTKNAHVLALISQLGKSIDASALNHIMAILMWELPLSRL